MRSTDELQMAVMTCIVELVELRGQARQDRYEALERMQREQDIVPLLLGLMREDNLGYVHRSMAAELLAAWHDERVLPVLEELLASDIEALQDAALATLYRFGDPDGIERLIALLDRSEPGLAQQVCGYLGASRSALAVAPLTRIIDDENVMLRDAAIGALASHGSNAAREALEASAQRTEDAATRAKIQAALAGFQE